LPAAIGQEPEDRDTNPPATIRAIKAENR